MRAKGLTTLATSPVALPVSGGPSSGDTGPGGGELQQPYPERGIFQRLLERLRAITVGEKGYVPVLAVALRS